MAGTAMGTKEYEAMGGTNDTGPRCMCSVVTKNKLTDAIEKKKNHILKKIANS